MRIADFSGGMSKRERILGELNRLPEQDLDSVLAFLELIKKEHTEKDAVAGPDDEAWAWANW
jgi:hypothetical protein